VIDIGCGSGVIANHLARCAARVDAVDVNPSAVEYARAHAAGPNVRFHLGWAEDLAFGENTFDFAYCMEVIEHLPLGQISRFLAHVRRILKPGGRLFVTTPNYRSLWPAVEFVMDRLRLAPRLREDQHVTKFTAERLRRIGRRAGLSELRLGRFCGLGPFASVLSWRLGVCLSEIEDRLASPLGNLLYAVWRKQ
jgi:2-polyprenyl-6-hydroxyphenyl methylase/3-demethylubiquinone-9 3-methyltransferase